MPAFGYMPLLNDNVHQYLTIKYDVWLLRYLNDICFPDIRRGSIRELNAMASEDVSILPPADDTLREHLGYAVDLMAMSLKEIGEPPHADRWREWYRQMSIIEVFWCQARILVEFFTGALASTTTAAAIHFTKGEIPYEFPMAQKLKDMRNDQIAHLNYARATDSELKLKPEHMYLTAGAIERALKLFESNLRDDMRKIWDARITGRQRIKPEFVYVAKNFTASSAGPTVVRSLPFQGHTRYMPPDPRPEKK